MTMQFLLMPELRFLSQSEAERDRARESPGQAAFCVCAVCIGDDDVWRGRLRSIVIRPQMAGREKTGSSLPV